jgi:tetratricopeptide (TPR) repeat protein
MADDNKNDDRSFDDIIADLDRDIGDDGPATQSPPRPKPTSKPAPKPTPKPAPVPPSNRPDKPAAEEKGLTPEKMETVHRLLEEAQEGRRKSKRKTNISLATISLAVVLMLAGIYLWKSKPPDVSFDPATVSNKTAFSAPASITEGDPFIEPRTKLKEARAKVASGARDGMTELQRVTEKWPESPQAADALLLMGATYQYNKKEPDRAADAYIKFLDTFPDHKQAFKTRKILIQLLAENGKLQDAKAHAKKLLDSTQNEGEKKFAQYYLSQ